MVQAQGVSSAGAPSSGGISGAAVMPVSPTVSGSSVINGSVSQPSGPVNFQEATFKSSGFDSFVSSSVQRSQPTGGTTSGGGSDFESFISTTTIPPAVSGVSTPNTGISTTYTSAQGNVGGSIYVPYDGPVFTGPGLEGGALLAENLLDDNVSKERDLKELVIGWTNFLLSVAALLAVIAIVWAGFLYVTAAGDDGRMETAKKIIIWVFIGIILILGAYAIVNTVMLAAF